MYVKSIPTGNKLPAKIIKKSLIRRYFLFPDILVEYEGTGLKGIKNYATWMYQSEIFN